MATVGGSPTRRTLGTLNQALTTWGFYVAGGSGFKTGPLMGEAEIAARHDRRAAAAAETFFQAVAQRKYLQPSFRALMTFKIQQRAWQVAGADPIARAGVDYRYWEGRGWLDPRVSYYIPHQAGRVKTALARMAGAALAPLVT